MNRILLIIISFTFGMLFTYYLMPPKQYVNVRVNGIIISTNIDLPALIINSDKHMTNE